MSVWLAPHKLLRLTNHLIVGGYNVPIIDKWSVG